MTDPDTITLDAQTAEQIRVFLQDEREEVLLSWHTDKTLAIFDRWIAALTPPPRTVPDGPFDQYWNGATHE